MKTKRGSSAEQLTVNQDFSTTMSLCKYQDHAVDTPSTDTVPSRNQSRVGGTFPVRLYDMIQQVESENLSHIVGWQTHGRSFQVRDQEKFVGILLPMYFHQSKLASFHRQLNLYNFVRILSGPDRGSYYHEMFLRGKEFLVPKIKRTSVKEVGVRNVSQPNFYAMAPLPETKTAGVGPAGSNMIVPTVFSMVARPSTQESLFRPVASARAAESGISIADSISNAIATRQIVNELNRKAAIERTALAQPLAIPTTLLNLEASLQHVSSHRRLLPSSVPSPSLANPPALLNVGASLQHDSNHSSRLLPSSVPLLSTITPTITFQSLVQARALNLTQSLSNQAAMSNLEDSLQRHSHSSRLLPSSSVALLSTIANTTNPQFNNNNNNNNSPPVPGASEDDALRTALLHQILSRGR